MKLPIKNKPIYIDVCALCRLFDEQNYLRIRLETEAVNLILSKVKEGSYGLLVSPVHNKEIEAISNIFERIELQTLLEKLGIPVNVDISRTRNRAEELVTIGFGVADAAHIAFAELTEAEFITCDDKLIKKCTNHKIKTWSGNPVAFCEKENLR